MAEVKKITGTPDPMASFDEKLSDEYGIKIGKYISGEWFSPNGLIGGSCEFLNRREYVRKKRLFVRGEYDILNFKQDYSPREGALELVNLDFNIINVAEKFCRIVSNGISDENYMLDIRANDRFTAIQKENRRDYLSKYMAAKPMLEKYKELFPDGVDMMPKGYVPESEDDLNLYMSIKERPRIEIAEEILINYVLGSNDWDFIGREFNKDLVDVGLVICRVFTDKNDGVKVDYVDPENYVHSTVKRRDFKDKYYEGYVDTITISDLRRESDFTEEELKKIAKLHNTQNNFRWDTCTIDDIVDFRVDVLRFAYKTSKKIVFKKKTRKGETIKLSKRSDKWEGNPTNTMSKTLDTWLEGNYILASDFIYGYKECENLYDDVMNKAMSPFITFAHKIYENRLQSFATNIEQPAKELQRITVKIQQLIKELKPDGIAIDVNQLAELDDGKGGSKTTTWEQTLNLWEMKGIAFVKTINMGEDGVKTGAAVSPLGLQQGSAFIPLLNSWAHYYNLIRENTGINPARDGSMAPDALVGVNQLAQLASNTVTRDIVETAVMFKKRICETISSRIKSIFTYNEAKHLKEIYENVVSKEMLDGLDIIKNRHLHEFGFLYEMYPTSAEIEEFKTNLSLAVQEGYIDAYIHSEAVMIAKTNIKLAIEYVRANIKQAKKMRMQEQMALAENKSKNDAMAAQAKSQAETQAYAMQKDMDVKAEMALSKIRITEKQAMMMLEAPMKEKEFKEDVYLTKLKAAGDLGIKEYLEDRKDQRTDLQATQQSKLKKQSQINGPAIDFSNDNSWYEPQL